jgi:hypothetical protein
MLLAQQLYVKSIRIKTISLTTVLGSVIFFGVFYPFHLHFGFIWTQLHLLGIYNLLEFIFSIKDLLPARKLIGVSGI